MLTSRNQEKFRVDYGLTDVVFDWADGGDVDERVRVEAVRKFVEDVWGLRCNQRAEIVRRFRAEKEKHRNDIELCAGVDPRNGIRLFVFGELPR